MVSPVGQHVIFNTWHLQLCITSSFSACSFHVAATPHAPHALLSIYMCVYTIETSASEHHKRKKPKKRMEAEQIKTPVCGGDDNVNNSEKEKTKTALMRAFVERRDPDAKVSFFFSLPVSSSLFGVLGYPSLVTSSMILVVPSFHASRFPVLITTTDSASYLLLVSEHLCR